MNATKPVLNAVLLGLALLVLTLAPAQARELVPTPIGGGVGVTTLVSDEAGSVQIGTDIGWHDQWEDKIRQDFNDFQRREKSEGNSNLGGYDNEVVSTDDLRHSSLAITSSGEIYLAAEVYDVSTGYGIQVFLSEDDGNTFVLWDQLHNALLSEQFRAPSILIAEGIADRIYLIYTRITAGESQSIRMVTADLPAKSFASKIESVELTIMAEVGVDYDNPHLASDAASFNSYFLYVVAERDPGISGAGIHFARSTDRGVAFESPYALGSLGPVDRGYFHPRIDVGYGGYVHVVWDFAIDGITDDDAIRYRRCPDYANGGLPNWEAMVAVTSRASGIWERKPRLAASIESDDVMIAYSRREWVNDSYFSTRTVGTMISRDAGANWEAEVLAGGNMMHAMAMRYKSATDQFILGGNILSQAGIQRASRFGSVSWSPLERLADQPYSSGYIYDFDFALNESHNQQVCTVWPFSNPNTSPDKFYFDAEWRADPGYPNCASGFPVSLPEITFSDPVVVDLDGDGDLEILFTDKGNNIQAYHHDGTTVTGWPVNIGAPVFTGLYHQPVAVGDLNGNGQLTVVASNQSGMVHAFNPDGQIESGFPYAFPDNVPVFVSIGALGGTTPRVIVCVGGDKLRYIDYRGQKVNGSISWNFLGQNIIYPAAMGDLDGDGITEIVIASLSQIIAMRMESAAPVWIKDVPVGVSGPPALADFDGDGDVEVVVPSAANLVYGLDETGSDLPGFPITVPSGTTVGNIALAQILGTSSPELIFYMQGTYELNVYYSGGVSSSWFPQPIGPSFRHSPVVNNVDSSFVGDIISGSEDQHIYAYTNFGNLVTGWPRDVGDWINRSAATGDLDQDGTVEVVFLAETELMVFDLNSTPSTGTGVWPMYGHNPQRTGCLNCPEDVVSAVGDDPTDPLTTRVSFAAPSPNPTNGPTLFSFNLPVRAAVRLDVYDLRGHRVRSVFRAEVPAGHHSLNWDGRDNDGRALASGVYFANLKVNGPGVNQELSRKVNFLK